MKPSTVVLQYFVGKVCTLFVSGVFPRQFTDHQFNDYFVGFVEKITDDAIITRHPVTGCKNYYALSHVVGISEEQVLDPAVPAEAAMIEELKKQGVVPDTKVMPVQSNNSPYADIDLMADLARQAKELEKK